MTVRPKTKAKPTVQPKNFWEAFLADPYVSAPLDVPDLQSETDDRARPAGPQQPRTVHSTGGNTFLDIDDDNNDVVEPRTRRSSSSFRPDTDSWPPLDRDFAQEIRGLLKEAFATEYRTAAEQEALVRTVLQDTALDLAPVAAPPARAAEPGLPTAAPALFLERDDRREKAPDFIKRVYKSWLGQGLTQAHIRRLDKSLYMALHQWLQLNAMPKDLDLPTKAGLNSKLLQDRQAFEALDDAARMRLQTAQRMRRLRAVS